MNKQTTTFLQPLVLATTLFIAAPLALAVDGEKLINMAKVATGGLTPGDTAGFPVTISQPGSYKLSGNLTVPNANTNAILITSDHVTVNLNGFAILGPTDCSGGLNPCVNEGTGSGITTGGDYFGSLGTPHFNITIRNGTIQGMGQDGVFLYGDSHLVEYLHVRSNGQSGISIPQSLDKGSSIVQNNTAERNSVDGIQVDRGVVSHNVTDVNFAGIDMQNGTASYNVVTRNAAVGLNIRSASYIGNTMDGNQSSVVGGVNMGQNLCNNVVCSGAHY